MLCIHLVKGCQLISGSKSFYEKWGVRVLWINRPSIARIMRCKVSWNWSAAKCSLDFQHSWKWISFSLFWLPWAPDICSFLCSGWRKRQRARKAIEPVAINGYFGTGWRYKGGGRGRGGYCYRKARVFIELGKAYMTEWFWDPQLQARNWQLSSSLSSPLSSSWAMFLLPKCLQSVGHWKASVTAWIRRLHI